MRGNILSIAPFDTASAGKQTDSSEIGIILQLPKPWAGSVWSNIKDFYLSCLINSVYTRLG